MWSISYFIGVAEAGGLHVPTKAPNVLTGILKECEYLEIYTKTGSMTQWTNQDLLREGRQT